MVKPENKKSFQLLIHFIGWAIVFGFPMFFVGRDADNTADALRNYLIHSVVPVSFLIVFYVNYFLLIDRYLFTKRQVWKYVAINLLLIAVFASLVHLWLEGMRPTGPEGPAHERPVFLGVVLLLRNCFMLMLTVGVSLCIKMTYKWYRAESERRELENSRTESELKNLKNQLNPHFLFNTLNNIYSLIAFSPQKAQQAVHDLSKLLRYVLYDSNHHFVPVEKELSFIENYIELMRIRLSDSVVVETHISDRFGPGTLVAPLLFITLIENAFKHGVSNSEPSFVRIEIYPSQEQYMVCEVANSCFPKSNDDMSGSGIGLENLRKRLDLLYKNDYMLTVDVKECIYTAKLVVSLKSGV